MEIDRGTAKDIKLFVEQMYETPHGETFLEFMKNICGEYMPQYDPTNSASISIAAGRAEVLATIKNIKRLTEEQIVAAYNNGEQYE